MTGIDLADAVGRVARTFAKLESDPALAKLLSEDAPPPAQPEIKPAPQPDIDPEPCKRSEPMTSNGYPNREAWLQALLAELRGAFKRLGHPIPERVRIGVGFPSVRGVAAKDRRIGECWSSESSEDQHVEIIVSPVLAEPMRVAGVLTHELCHAVVGHQCGHKGPFRALATALGLEGRMTATTEGDAFRALAAPILEGLGPYPHGELRAMSNGRKKQAARLIKCECPECGYVARVARQWLDKQGAPHCPGGIANGEADGSAAHGAMRIAAV